MLINDYVNIPIPRQKRIALIAHDHKKQDLVDWVKDNITVLRKHFLCGTGTTARLIAEEVELPVRAYNSGPLGGDLQIGSRIVEGAIDMVIFFWDPLEAQPHDPDVKALLRIAAVYDIPIANNRATADFLLTSSLMDGEYNRRIINYNKKIQDRLTELQEK
ncbi:MAG: methylglyoxal synthase [Clostridiaceae bacterium]|jgi:methylglyoxal synthase|nr:methylglyoxal synthase [Clostridiaceae bacterium]